jgi:Ca2+-binding RTX toxin-like protein
MGASSQLLNDGTIIADSAALVSTGGNSIVNNGTMSAQSDSTIFESSGDNNLVNHGAIDTNSPTHYGVYFLDSGNTVTNTGTISGGAAGVYFNAGGGDNYLNNSGTISGDYSINMGFGGGRITNDGHLYGNIDLGSGVTHLTNTGTIAGGIVANIGSGHANDTIVNDGLIDGGINFSAASTYNGRLGSITGDVIGSTGADKLIGGANADSLQGSGGNDVLKGNDGDDTLYGGAGRDKMFGGDGDDTFVYHGIVESRGVNYDTIVGFDAAHDTIAAGVTINAVLAASGTLDSGANFTAEMATILTTGHLPAHDATLVTASGGNLAGDTFLVIDTNGTAGYQANADYVIQLSHSVDASLTADNFA